MMTDNPLMISNQMMINNSMLSNSTMRSTMYDNDEEDDPCPVGMYSPTSSSRQQQPLQTHTPAQFEGSVSFWAKQLDLRN
jgi:hypothetical protein